MKKGKQIHNFTYGAWVVTVYQVPEGFAYTATQTNNNGSQLHLDGMLARAPYELNNMPMIASIEASIRNNISRQERQAGRRIYGRNKG